MSFRYATNVTKSKYWGDPLPDQLWERLCISLFFNYKYVGFNGITNAPQLESIKLDFELEPIKPIKLKTEWPKEFGGTVRVDQIQLFRITESFKLKLFNCPLEFWNGSNFPFDNVFLLQETNTTESMICLEGSENSFTFFSKEKYIPQEIINADPQHLEHCIFYDDLIASLV